MTDQVVRKFFVKFSDNFGGKDSLPRFREGRNDIVLGGGRCVSRQLKNPILLIL